MLVVDRFGLDRQYGANTYVLRATDASGEAVVVDPGGDPAPLLAALASEQITMAAILVTHCDVDHIGGVADLAAATGAPVWAPVGEAYRLREGRTRGGMSVAPHDPEYVVGDGDRIDVGGVSFEVVGVAGHSEDHIAFAHEGEIFAGDLLFAGSVGRVDLPGGDWQALLDSVSRLLTRYGPDAVVYPGHGGPTRLGHELASNPFLGELRAAAQ
ncbi:MAG: MBL fold metallo-hydrolase [Actinomycetes bacterium]